MDDEETPWFADIVPGTMCAARQREQLWTLTKGAKRIDAEPLYHGEDGVEVQFAHEGVMAHAHRCVRRAEAAAEDRKGRRTRRRRARATAERRLA